MSIGLLERNVVQAKFLGRFSYLEFVLSFEQTKKKSEQSKASVLACACLDIMQNAIICRKEANLEAEFWKKKKKMAPVRRNRPIHGDLVDSLWIVDEWQTTILHPLSRSLNPLKGSKSMKEQHKIQGRQI